MKTTQDQNPRGAKADERRIDESLLESFPASDPPAHHSTRDAESINTGAAPARNVGDLEATKTRKHSKAFYAEARRRAARPDDAHAFVSDPAEHRAPVADDLAEELGEDYVASATTGEETGQESRDEVVPEETGGPFLKVAGDREFAPGTDPSNPADAERAPFPQANADRRQ